MSRVPPNMNLPESAMPWGRWLSDTALLTRDRLDAIMLDANSAGSNMKSRLDNISQNISTLSHKLVMRGEGADIRSSVLNPSTYSHDSTSLSFAIPSGVSDVASVNVRYSQPSLVTQPSGSFLADWLVVRVNGNEGINFGRATEASIVFGTSYPFYDIYASVNAQFRIIPGVVNVVTVELWSFITAIPGFTTNIKFEASDILVHLTLEEEGA